MQPRCRECGRFMSRLTKGVGLPFVTGFPYYPSSGCFATSIPQALFACRNPKHAPYPIVQYFPVNWER